MKPVVIEMIEMFQTYEVDWLGYPITEENMLTFHHVEKKADGGLFVLENGALLTLDAHEELNTIENKDYKVYMLLTNLFKKLNESKKPPTEEYWHELREILSQYKTRPAPVKLYKRII